MDRLLLLIAMFFAITARAGTVEPRVTNFHVDTGNPSESEWENFGDVAVTPVGQNLVARVWTNLYGHQDRTKAHGWLVVSDKEHTLCFAAPNLPPEPSSPAGAADAGVVFAVLLTYEISGLSVGTPLTFSDKCRLER